MLIKLILKNELGEFESNLMQATPEEYEILMEKSKSFYSTGFEMYIEDGFMVVPPEIVRKSILIVKILEEEIKENGNKEQI